MIPDVMTRRSGGLWLDVEKVMHDDDQHDDWRPGAGAAANAGRVMEPCTLVLFGASGDLTQRMVMPAIFRLARRGLLSPEFRLIGYARSKMTDDEFRARMRKAVMPETGAGDEQAWTEFAARLSYPAEYEGDTCRATRELARRFEMFDRGTGAGAGARRLFYLATPPALFAPIMKHLGDAKLAGQAHQPAPGGWARFVIEKPFGHDLASARALNADIARSFEEHDIYRIDHLLGKEIVQSLFALRFANGISNPCGIATISITFRSRRRKRSVWKGAGATMKPPVPYAIWCRTICSNSARWSPSSRPPNGTHRRTTGFSCFQKVKDLRSSMNEKINLRSLTLCLTMLFAAASQALAHEKWFHETQNYRLRWDLFFRPLPLVLFGAVLLATLVTGLWWRRRGRGFVPGPENFGTTDDRRSALYGLIPAILGIHVAVPLLVSGVQGELFTPNNKLPGVWMYALGLAQTGIALAIFYGALTRLAAIALALLWFGGIFLVGLEPMLESSMYLGFAVFFFFAGRGPISIDRLVLPKLEPSAQLMATAIPALRAGLGLSLVVVAFTEKFANIPLASAFLERYPLNFTAAFGIPMSNETFILCAGAIELLVGLWVLFGIFPREIILIAWIPINLTLTVFNWTELVGHLPIYGMFAVLLIWSPGRENLALWLSGLREGPLAILGQDAQSQPKSSA